MRIAVIELHVDVTRRRRTAGEVSDADAIVSALRAKPDPRNALALEAIEVAAAFEPAVIVCPGWTFVGCPPRPGALARAAEDAALLYEVLAERGDAGAGQRTRRRRAPEPAALELPSRTHVLVRGAVRELPPQTVGFAADLDGARSDAAPRFAAALKAGRQVNGALVLVDAEVNAVRRFVQRGERARYAWNERVARAGIPARDLSDALVLNPAHVPAGSYVRDKRRAGPWRAIVSTANALDRNRIGRTPLAPPAHAVIGGRDLEPAVDPVAVGEGGSRVVVFDVATD